MLRLNQLRPEEFELSAPAPQTAKMNKKSSSWLPSQTNMNGRNTCAPVAAAKDKAGAAGAWFFNIGQFFNSSYPKRG